MQQLCRKMSASYTCVARIFPLAHHDADSCHRVQYQVQDWMRTVPRRVLDLLGKWLDQGRERLAYTWHHVWQRHYNLKSQILRF